MCTTNASILGVPRGVKAAQGEFLTDLRGDLKLLCSSENDMVDIVDMLELSRHGVEILIINSIMLIARHCSHGPRLQNNN